MIDSWRGRRRRGRLFRWVLLPNFVRDSAFGSSQTALGMVALDLGKLVADDQRVGELRQAVGVGLNVLAVRPLNRRGKVGSRRLGEDVCVDCRLRTRRDARSSR